LINNNNIKIKRKYNKRKNNNIDHDSNNIGKYNNNINNNYNYINDSKNDRNNNSNNNNNNSENINYNNSNNNNNNNYDNNNSNNNSNKNIDNHINNNIDNNIDNSIENNINTNTNNSIENNTGNNINNNNSENINKNNNLNTSNNINNNKNNNVKNNDINMSTSTMKNITDNRQINHLYNNNYNINNNIKNYNGINNSNYKINNNQDNANDNKNNQTNIYTNAKRKINNYDNTISNKRPKRDIIEPTTYKEIFNLPDKKEWIDAVKEELNNMENLEVFKTVKNIPESANLISCRWIFKYKKNAEGKIVKRKARLVAKGYTQKQGIDYHDTFAPTLKHDSIRILTAIATKNNFNIEQIDINTAYLNARLKEEIYMNPQEGHPDFNKNYLKLNKAIYGLKQSGLEWNNELNNYLIKIGFRRVFSEPCLYVKENKRKSIICILGVYVDDILIAGNKGEIILVKKQIKNKFKIKEIGNVDFIIGIKFIKTY